MIDLFNYLNEHMICEDEFVGSSDKAIYKRLAQHKWNHITDAAKEKHKKKYSGIPKNTVNLIKWFKESNGEILKEEDEILPRSKWNQLEQVGEIENSLMSPHKWTYFDYICKNPRPKKNKILVVLECSNSKPYCQDNSKKWYFSRFRSFADFACGAYGIVPEEYSQMYPVRMDEWAHSDESESVAFKYNLISCNRGYKYIKEMGYEKVIVYFQNPAPEEFMKWMKNMPGMEDKLIFVINEALFKKVSKNHPNFHDNWGLITTRMMLMPEAHEAFMKAMKSCLDGEDLERFKEIEKLIKDDDKTGQKKWIEETNEKFEIEPYKPEVTGWPKKLKQSEIPLHTYTSDVTREQVDEYKSWLKKWAEKQDKKEIDEDTKFATERLLFTPLDLLIDMYGLGEDKPNKQDIDALYWNMMKAIEEVADEIGVERLNLDKYGRYKYLWVFSRCLKEKSRKEMIKYSDKVGLSQFYQNPLKR